MNIYLTDKQASALRLAAAFVDSDEFTEELQAAINDAYDALEEQGVEPWIDSGRIWDQ